MYPAPFEYHVPSTVAEAVSLLGKWQDDAKLISGSQSLIPMMKLRLVQPKHVIDLRKVPGLAGVSESDGALLTGPLSTVLEPSEILVQVRIPLPGARSGSAYEKLPNPASRFAVVGVAAAVTLDAKGAVQRARVALTGLGPKVSRAASVEQALQGKPTSADSLESAASRAAEGLELRADGTGSGAHKAHLAAVYTA